MQDHFSLRVTDGGLEDEIEKIWTLSRLSNDFARATYGLDFYLKCENSPEAIGLLDLKAIKVDGRYLPVLKEGSNRYETLSRERLRLREDCAPPMHVDAFLVVPELSRLLNRRADATGLKSALSNSEDAARRLKIVDPLPWLAAQSERSDEVRAFDSHPSTGTYFCCLRTLLQHLSLPVPTFDLMLHFRQYRCDLASRFSPELTTAIFASDTFFVEEYSSPQGGNTGVRRLYENREAPIRASILLIGDSHSYSALSQMCSFLFTRVEFFWASRRNGYHPYNDEVIESAKNHNFVVEEVSERFFLANFCEPAV